MPALDSKLRSQLDDVCQKARDLAVAYAQSALQKRGVSAAEALSHFGPKDKELRNRLRARGRLVGDVRNADGTQSIEQLSQELAYEYWHRMLFARFLAENHLLMHPDGVAVSLEECDELASEADAPAANGFVLAARYASTMLPQIFRTDDVLLEIEFAPEQRLALEKLLASLPKQTFEADDSLGWVYQFWQTAEKKRVNGSGDKIDGRTLPAVTQLFTEHYMVEFLLHNTIGAWWCAKEGIQGPPGGVGIPAGKSPDEMPYLRWRDDGTPAAGKFEGWPRTLAEFTMLDPCCGSGHFLVAAFNLLVPLRMHGEGLSAAEACEAVLRDNLFGLELDPRCTQIAAFALALAAWKYPDAGGYRPLPSLNIACSGQGVTGKKDEWLSLANGDDKLRNGMNRLYDLFQQAPHLGSLIDPRREKGDLYQAGYADLQPLLAKALVKKAGDADLSAVGVAARGITRAAEILVARYTLVITNVPYLGKSKQDDVVKKHLEDHYAAGKADLATAFVLRCLDFCRPGGSTALVTPQNWLFLASYAKVRKKLLTEQMWNCLVLLGEEAWWTFGNRGPRTVLQVLTARTPDAGSDFFGIDVSTNRGETPILLDDKVSRLANRVQTPIQLVGQANQLENPDAKVILTELMNGTRLGDIAIVSEGLHTGDYPRFGRKHWELSLPREGWARQQGGTGDDEGEGGCEHVMYWQGGKGELIEFVQERLGGQSTSMWIKGEEVWGKRGVTVGTMNELNHAHYTGALFTHGVVAVVANVDSDLPAIWCYISSDRFRRDVRQLDQKVSVARASIENVQLDLAHWRSVANVKYPTGLPSPDSNDPTQWLFKGEIAMSTDPLQVAIARLLGYRWPEHSNTEDAIDKLADEDGILCVPGVRGEVAAAERLLEVLHAAYGKSWSDSELHRLLTVAGAKAGMTLDDWLRNQFFEQHCKRFQSRPFIWHIWDGRKDGFSALVNYHKLTHKALENLTYSYLGDWITAQGRSDKTGADSRLGAAQALQEKLKLILAGEPPYDIFVRWKPLHEQAIGWNPNLNDGVRMNIRPFMEAGILRKNPNIKWTKDRGKEPQRQKADYPWFWSGKEFVGDRVNDIHLTNAEKQAARNAKK
jgi:hypothetical protein